MKFSIKDFFSKCDQVFLRILSQLQKKFLRENFIFYGVFGALDIHRTIIYWTHFDPTSSPIWFELLIPDISMTKECYNLFSREHIDL